MLVIPNKKTELQKKVSRNFHASEFVCHCRTCDITLIDEELLKRLQILRDLWGSEINITSGYRCQRHNQRTIGSAQFSYHMCGKAADIAIPKIGCKQHFIKYIDAVFPYYYEGNGFVHVDVRGLCAFNWSVG